MPGSLHARLGGPRPLLLPALSVLLLLLLLAADLAPPCAAYPDFWLDSTAGQQDCTSHPISPVGGAPHGTPLADSTIVIQALSDDGEEALQLCPGRSYKVRVQFPQRRRALVSATAGSFDQQPAGVVASTECPNRLVMGPSEPFTSLASLPTALEARLTLPCNLQDQGVAAAATPTVVLRVTSVAAGTIRWRNGSRTYDAPASCAAPGCGLAAPATQPPPQPERPVPAAGKLPPPAPAVEAASGRNDDRSGGGGNVDVGPGFRDTESPPSSQSPPPPSLPLASPSAGSGPAAVEPTPAPAPVSTPVPLPSASPASPAVAAAVPAAGGSAAVPAASGDGGGARVSGDSSATGNTAEAALAPSGSGGPIMAPGNIQQRPAAGGEGLRPGVALAVRTALGMLLLLCFLLATPLA